MIRIHKPGKKPAILRNRRAREAAARHRKEFDSKTMPAKFDKTIYGAESVKKALRRAQHEKCAFCESHLTHISYGDVEHLRPKAAVAQYDGDPLERPGYYWLAYEWDNLFLSCQLCNQRFKRNLFPLRDQANRVRSHHDHSKLDAEGALLIDPSATDPERHILWKREYPEPAPGSDEGSATIGVVGLDREELVTVRRAYLRTLFALREAILGFRDEARSGSLSSKGHQRLAQLEAHVVTLQGDEAQYAAMARAFFATL
jgi:uncharacterized protein (TIGR02646 family)